MLLNVYGFLFTVYGFGWLAPARCTLLEVEAIPYNVVKYLFHAGTTKIWKAGP